MTTTPATGGSGRRHAVVIGASIAGLLAARTLGDHFDRVTLLDRDDLPGTPAARGGVPQGRHTHGLLAEGRRIIEEMFPGSTEDLVRRGGRIGDPGRSGTWCFTPRPLASCDTGLQMLLVGRPLLEWYVRERLVARAGVELRDDTSVLDLAFSADERRVVGVVVQDRDGGSTRLVPADLVVDASGRNSRTPEWLERRGYRPPEEEVRRVDKRYTTFRLREAGDGSTPLAVAVSAQPGIPRGGIMLAEEGGLRVVSLIGRGGVTPPVDWPDFAAWAGTLSSSALARTIGGLTPVDDGATYRFPANRRRHYDRLTAFPAGLLVTGDALCAFDPVYGQGMTVAAIEAVALDRCLSDPGPDLAAQFHAAAARAIETPWTIAVGDTPAEDGTTSLRQRVMSTYLARLLRAACTDATLATTFIRVAHLADGPQRLLRPAVVARVLRHRERRPTEGGASAGVERGVVVGVR